MAADPVLRQARTADEPAIADLVARVLDDGGPLTAPGFWEWKHRQSPFGPSRMWIAETAGEVVALRVFLPWRWSAGGRPVRAVRAVDTATLPGYRRQGLFRRLTLLAAAELEREGVELVFNTPNASSRPGYLRMGWHGAGRVPLLIRPSRPLKLLRSTFRFTRSGSVPPHADLPPMSALLADQGLDPFLDRFAAEQRRDSRLSTVRSREYLEWRYGDVPGLHYQAVWDLGADGSGAVLVLRTRHRRGLAEGTLCEVLSTADARGETSGIELLRSVTRELQVDHCLAAAAPSSPERRSLRRSGFVPVPAFGPSLVLRALADREAAGLSVRNFRAGIGDFELF